MEFVAAVLLWVLKAMLLISAWEACKAVKRNGIKHYIGY